MAAAGNQVDLFVIRHGQMTDVGPIDPSKPFGDIKINIHGDIIGFALANGDAAINHRGKLIDLGSLAGLGSAARALNDQDQVVGYSAVSSTGSSQVVHAFLVKHGKMMDIGTLGGADSVANDINARRSRRRLAHHQRSRARFPVPQGSHARPGHARRASIRCRHINNKGQVVGGSLVSGSVTHGFLYNRGKMIDLNSLLPANSGFVIVNAQDINNRGQIAAQAISTNPNDPTQYVVILNPKR